VLKTTSKKEEEELDEEPAFSQLDAKRPENLLSGYTIPILALAINYRKEPGWSM
jgi:hypothetical protein